MRNLEEVSKAWCIDFQVWYLSRHQINWVLKLLKSLLIAKNTMFYYMVNAHKARSSHKRTFLMLQIYEGYVKLFLYCVWLIKNNFQHLLQVENFSSYFKFKVFGECLQVKLSQTSGRTHRRIYKFSVTQSKHQIGNFQIFEKISTHPTSHILQDELSCFN